MLLAVTNAAQGLELQPPRHEVKPKERRLRPAQSMKALQELVDRIKIELRGSNTATNVQRNQRRSVRQIVIQSINRLTSRHHPEMKSKQHTYSLSPMHRGYCIFNLQLKVFLNLPDAVSRFCSDFLGLVLVKGFSRAFHMAAGQRQSQLSGLPEAFQEPHPLAITGFLVECLS